jgi:hypothetical protein
MDFVSISLLGALNIPILVSLCRWFQRTFHKDKDNFWGSLLRWSFDAQAFFDKEHKHNHLAVLFISLSVGCCALLVPIEYEAASKFVDLLRVHHAFQALTKF